MKPLRNPSLAVLDPLREQAVNPGVTQSGNSKTVFLLVDNENVQLKCLNLPDTGKFRVMIFSGVNQHSIPEQLVRDTQPMGSDCEYVKVDRIGKNAVDFYIAFHLGRLATENPDSEFYVVSKDTGFDPLIRYLNGNRLRCQRITSVASLNLSNHPYPKSREERLAAVVNHLKKFEHKPGSRKALKNTITAYLKEELSDSELEILMERLKLNGVIEFDGDKVSYYFS